MKMKHVLITAAAVLLFAGVHVSAAGDLSLVREASAQPAPRRAQPVLRRDRPTPRRAQPTPSRRPVRIGAPTAARRVPAGHAAIGKKDTRELGNSKPMALLFWLFSLAIIGGAIFVITRRNLVVAVMGMVGTFFAIAAVFAMLYAHFMAVIQVLVYAGAIMVLFVFVVMILNRPEDEPYGKRNWFGRGLALAASAYLLVRIGSVLWSYRPINPAAGLAPGKTIEGIHFGSTEAVGTTLFGEYLFPFEAVSLVLLIAVVGAIAVARPLAKRETLETDPAAPALDGAE